MKTQREITQEYARFFESVHDVDSWIKDHIGDVRNFDESVFHIAISQTRNHERITPPFGQNILEMAINAGNEKATLMILEHTRLNISASKFLITAYDNDNELIFKGNISPLLFAVRFGNMDLLNRLGKRSVEKVISLENARLSTKEFKEMHAICLALHYPFDSEDDFRSFIWNLKSLLDKPCPGMLTPFRYALLHGPQRGQKLAVIASALCGTNPDCKKELVCNTTEPQGNSLHLISAAKGNHTESLNYVFGNGADECWQNEWHGQNALQIAQQNKMDNTTSFYNSRIGRAEIVTAGSMFWIILPAAAVIIIFILLILLYKKCRSKNNIEFIASVSSTLNKKFKHEKIIPSVRLLTLTKDYTNHCQILDSLIDLQFDDIPYNGPLSVDKMNELINNHDSVGRQYRVAALPYFYPQFPNCKVFPFYVKFGDGDLPQQLITHPDAIENHITFYIPGTGSTVEHAHIDLEICKHLAKVMRTSVLSMHHGLAPVTRWPGQLDQVCGIIRDYVEKNKPTKMNIVAYSMGGLLATLAVLTLRELGIQFNRLILLAPALDLGGEFRFLDANSDKRISALLPKQLKLEHITKLQSLIKPNDFFKKDDQQFTQSMAHCFNDFAKPPKKLRKYSPTWFQSCHFRENFPDVTIIVGRDDYFLIDSVVFFERLRDAGCSATKIVISNTNHFIFTHAIYPLYLVQKVKKQKNDIEINLKQIVEIDKTLRTDAHKKPLTDNQVQESSDELKSLCQRMFC